MNKVFSMLLEKDNPTPQRLAEYLKADKFMLKLIFVHWILVAVATGYLLDAYVLGIVGGGVLFFTTLIGYKYFKGTSIFRILVAIVLLSYTVIMIQQSLGRIEMHFHVFIALSFFVIYRDMKALTAGALFIAVHHLIFNYLQFYEVEFFSAPIVVFNYGCGLDIVLLHAAFVIFEWVVLSIIIAGKENDYLEIINMQNRLQEMNESLEEKVQERTKALSKSNKNIQDSIEYASLIQHSILPEQEVINFYFNDSFIFWKPAETVGGDIYFATQLKSKDEILIMVIDGAGHGVPGAFVTMLVKAIETQIMAEIANDKLSPSPAQILAYFNKSIKEMLKQEKGSKSNAGFDGGILYYNKKTKVCKYAGAKTPLYVVSNNELKIYKSDKKSIGFIRSKINQEFTEYDVILEEDTQLYILTDGYSDQPNKNRKKYDLDGVEKLILKMSKENFSKQKMILVNEFETFREKEKQIDDITVIGIKV